MTKATISFISPRLKDRKGITLVGFVAFIICLVIGITVALLVLRSGKRAAYEITVKHDLRKFVDAEEAYYSEKEKFKGKEGDIISNDPDKPSTFSLEGFTPSEDVMITIISDDPLIAIAKHKKAPAVFEYNFEEKVIKQK